MFWAFMTKIETGKSFPSLSIRRWLFKFQIVGHDVMEEHLIK